MPGSGNKYSGLWVDFMPGGQGKYCSDNYLIEGFWENNGADSNDAQKTTSSEGKIDKYFGALKHFKEEGWALLDK